eukprot:TRINITY_DN423_c0_g1_i4.p1 TRINITY_DN423_c0_g1~~TRINITY_DN423_c0_g1_i4.p1  ORF type:complete len:372 (+),score=135.42 TRINITY_DN423_c0_g1_i4:75-1190(+)
MARTAESCQGDDRIDPRFKRVLKVLPAFDSLVDIHPTREAAVKSRIQVLTKIMAQVPSLADLTGGNVPGPALKAQWADKGLDIKVVKIKSQPDNNTVKIEIIKPAGAQGLPVVYYIHGGGMAMGSAFDPTYKVWGRVIARQGVVVAMVDFRNSEIPSGCQPKTAPYPAGLNDCFSGLEYCHAHAAELGGDPARLIVSGESGGGNLTIATVLKAKREGKLHMVSGFYPLCPYIAGTWPQDVQNEGILGTSHLNSVNNGIWIAMGGTREMSHEAIGYGEEAFKRRDPLAWPGFATVDDLRGLPRCCIIVHECDPLRDEGIAFYRRMLQAGCTVQCRQIMGAIHGAELFAAATPEIQLSTASDIALFARNPLGA